MYGLAGRLGVGATIGLSNTGSGATVGAIAAGFGVIAAGGFTFGGTTLVLATGVGADVLPGEF